MTKKYQVTATRPGETVTHEFSGTFREASAHAVFEGYKNRNGENWNSAALIWFTAENMGTLDRWEAPE